MSMGLPYDGYYNGDTDMQMANGTYADFRHVLLKKVELGKMKQIDLDKLDKEWDAIALDEKQKRRGLVVEQSTPRSVTIQTHDGPVMMLKAVPSEGNNVKKEREKAKSKKEPKRPLGALTDENSPLTVTAKASTSSSAR